MRLLEEQGLRVIGRMVDRGCGAVLHDVAATLGLSTAGARVIVGRLDRAGYLRVATVFRSDITDLLVVGVTPTGTLALQIADGCRRRLGSRV